MPPRTIAVTAEEGGEWIPFERVDEEGYSNTPREVHSIKFEDGRIWDAVSGWRYNGLTEAEVRMLHEYLAAQD